MKLNLLLLLFCLLSALFSCKNEIEIPGEIIIVRLSPSFISLNQGEDLPMKVNKTNTKMSVDQNSVVYAIQIYENDSAYYYGLFDKVDSMTIAMTTGKTYRFKIATYKVGTGSGLKYILQPDGKYFFLPNKILLGNKFVKGDALKNINLISSIKLDNPIIKEYPEIDLFYCDKTQKLEKGLSNIDFKLIRMGFGVTYTVDGLTKGKLNVIMGNDTTVLNNLNSTNTSIRLFKVLSGDLSTIYTDLNTYVDSILIKVEWIESNGTLLKTQGKFKFTRNYQKTINIQLNVPYLNLDLEGWSNIVTDIDGNEYHTITIGNQVWMVENLKVTRYNDNSSIPLVFDNEQWGYLNSPAYCWYNNDVKNKNSYGALYNWYAVNSNKLCPKGWHIPSDSEWTILTDYLGGLTYAASKLKEQGNLHWIKYNNATNESKFTALPGGYRRYNDGVFFSLGSNCSFWSSSSNNGFAWARGMTLYDEYDLKDVLVISNNKNYGCSVRCIKD